MASEEWFSLSLQTKSFAAAATARFEIKQIFSFLIFEPWFFWSRRRCNTWLTLLSLCLLSYFKNYLLFRKYSTGHDDFVSNWEKIEKLSSLTSRLKAEKKKERKEEERVTRKWWKVNRSVYLRFRRIYAYLHLRIFACRVHVTDTIRSYTRKVGKYPLLVNIHWTFTA